MALLKNLFLYEPDNGTNGGNNNDQFSNDQDGNPSDGAKNTPQNVPYSRFKEVNDNYKAVKEELDKLKKDLQKADEDAKKKQGEFEALYNELKSKHDPLAEQFKAYEETLKEILKNKLEAVPEKFRSLIPKGNQVEQLKWLENAEKAGLFKTENVTSFGNNGNNPDNTSQKLTKGFLKGLSRF
jgi:chromosome segregation ATPase